MQNLENLIQQKSDIEAQQVNLLRIMKESDSHASKCQKLGLVFKEEYPAQYAAYQEANTQYNENEETLTRLQQEIDAEYARLQAEAEETQDQE